MDQTIYPSMWDGDSYVTVGDVFNNPTWGTVIKPDPVAFSHDPE